MPDDNSAGRIPGCESTNHDTCYGELWQCSCCGKIICEAEGSDDDPDLCDDCWVAKQTRHPDDGKTTGGVSRIVPEPTTDPPDMDTIGFWIWDGVAEATDGCVCELDGVCPHGHRSWLRELGIL